MGTLLQDLRYGLRMLGKNPGVTALAMLALAMGIGANTAIFSVADAFLLKPLPFPRLARLVQIEETLPQQSSYENSVTPANFEDFKNQSRSFEQMAAFAWASVNLTGDGVPQKAQGFLVTWNFFDTLGVRPMLGRAFLPEEDQPGRDQEAIIGHGLWERRYGADPNILGKRMTIDGYSYTVVGVMGREFDFPLSSELWMPLGLDAKQKNIRNRHYLWPVGYLKPGVSVAEARAEITGLAGRLEQQHPDTNKGWGARIVPLAVSASGDLTYQYTILLMVAVGFVLLIACANVANLQFARAASRHREIAVRTALGATRRRMIRQLLTESILLAFFGAALGLVFAQWSLDLILSHMPPDVAKYIAGWKDISLNRDALLFTLACAVLAGIISGLAPAFQSSRPDLTEALRDGGHGSTAGRARQRLRSVFVVAEVALSLILLVGAGLLVKGFDALLNVNQNFAPDSLLTMHLSLPGTKYKEKPQIVSFYEKTLQQIETIPGVEAVSAVTSVPYGHNGIEDRFSIEGQAPLPGDVRIARIASISPNYFRLMHIPLRQGREFSDADKAEAPPVAIISASLARRYFPGQNPIGQRIRQGSADSQAQWARIVGIVDDVRYDWIFQGPEPTIYQPFPQVPRPWSYLTIRTAGDPNSFIGAIRTKIAGVDPDQPLSDVKTLDRVISESVVGIAYVAAMMSVLGAIALLLSSVGVYGVMAYAVAERTHEIGIRMALGAQRRDVLRLMAGRGIILTVIGLAIGLPISFALARLLASLLFGVSASDPTIFVGIPALLSLVALIACFIPARRAMNVDPMVALRYE